MLRLSVTTHQPYEVLVGKGLLTEVGELAKETLGVCRICLVSDDTVDTLYGDTVRASLAKAGLDTVSFVFPHGESSKNTSTLVSLLEFLAENRLTRSDALVALGGGVVGDLAGFAAAVYLRGVRLIQIPSTLLAMVDSSVGGKTGVDLTAGKNLVGAFHQPSLVLCDPLLLQTLPPETLADGAAEVVKYAVIGDAALFDRLALDGAPDDEEVIASCIQHKIKLVTEDEFDRGSRQLLNLGHTAGHAIEALSSFSVSHGSAVAMGMVLMMQISRSLGLASEDEVLALTALLTRLGLPTKCPFRAEELSAVALSDKKRMGDTITLILPFTIGDSRLYPLPVAELTEFLRKGQPLL